MKKHLQTSLALLLAGMTTAPVTAQTTSSGSFLTAQPTADRIVPFRLSDAGITHEVEWGADLAWLSEANFRRCLAFMGADNVKVARTSFQPTYPLVDGALQEAQMTDLNERLRILKTFASPDVKLALNCDHPTVDSWYDRNSDNWVALIAASARQYEDAGYRIETISPFNEPDFGWNQWIQGSQDNNAGRRMAGFKEVATKLRENEHFKDVRICGGNTLNNDEALTWYNYLKDVLDEGNTHQLAGSFDRFAAFFTAVRANGHHATADEMHNVMEAMVGLEYGMQTGIWWGAAEYARGEFCKASQGERLAYAEHRNNWTAASVYRAPDGKIQAFGGTSERQAATTTYRFLSKERDVFFDGYGPQREYVMELPGGTGYQNGQTNAERVVNITWGDDVQPVVDGTYCLYNKQFGRVMQPLGGSFSNGNSLGVGIYSNRITYQNWNVKPVSPRCGGDFSYYSITPEDKPTTTLDVRDYSLGSNADIILYTNGGSTNQQWYLEYAGDGWFYIRNRHSSLCLQIGTAGSTITQGTKKEGNATQLWRFIPTDVFPSMRAIKAVTGISAKAQASSVLLSWNQYSDKEAVFSVLRSETEGGPYDLIARNVPDTAFVDHKVSDGHTYYYTVRAVNRSVTTSPNSEEVSAAPTGKKDMLVHLSMDENTLDGTPNLNHGATPDAFTSAEGKMGSGAFAANGTTAFVQLPTEIANHKALTLGAWVYWNGGNTWQRVFDFGNGEDEYMFLTVNSGDGKARFAIKNGGTEQQLNGNAVPTNQWTHLAVTIDENTVTLYQDGVATGSTSDITIRPEDFKPALNYIGRSQFAADPLFKGRIDEFRMYNYAMTADEIAEIMNEDLTAVHETKTEGQGLAIISAAHGTLTFRYDTGGRSKVHFTLSDTQGLRIRSCEGEEGIITTMDMSELPDGIYILKAVSGTRHSSCKVAIRR